MERLEKIFFVILLGCIAGAFINSLFDFPISYIYLFVSLIILGIYLIIKLIIHVICLIKKPKKKKSYNRSKNFLVGVGIFFISVLAVRNTSFVMGFIYTSLLFLCIGILIYKKKIVKMKKLVKILYLSFFIIFFVFLSSILYSFFCTFSLALPNYEHASDGSWTYIRLTSSGFIPKVTYSFTSISIGKTYNFRDDLEHIGTSSFGIFFYSEKDWPEICLTAITPAHFRTNVKTGECSFFPGSGCVEEMPKNYIEGCDKSLEEKAELLKNTPYWYNNISWFDEITNNCTEYCSTRGQKVFCFSVNNTRNLCEQLAEYK